MSGWADEETDNPLYADERDCYKLRKSTKHAKDGRRGEAVSRKIGCRTSLRR